MSKTKTSIRYDSVLRSLPADGGFDDVGGFLRLLRRPYNAKSLKTFKKTMRAFIDLAKAAVKSEDVGKIAGWIGDHTPFVREFRDLQRFVEKKEEEGKVRSDSEQTKKEEEGKVRSDSEQTKKEEEVKPETPLFQNPVNPAEERLADIRTRRAQIKARRAQIKARRAEISEQLKSIKDKADEKKANSFEDIQKAILAEVKANSLPLTADGILQAAGNLGLSGNDAVDFVIKGLAERKTGKEVDFSDINDDELLQELGFVDEPETIFESKKPDIVQDPKEPTPDFLPDILSDIRDEFLENPDFTVEKIPEFLENIGLENLTDTVMDNIQDVLDKVRDARGGEGGGGRPDDPDDSGDGGGKPDDSGDGGGKPDDSGDKPDDSGDKPDLPDEPEKPPRVGDPPREPRQRFRVVPVITDDSFDVNEGLLRPSYRRPSEKNFQKEEDPLNEMIKARFEVKWNSKYGDVKFDPSNPLHVLNKETENARFGGDFVFEQKAPLVVGSHDEVGRKPVGFELNASSVSVKSNIDPHDVVPVQPFLYKPLSDYSRGYNNVVQPLDQLNNFTTYYTNDIMGPRNRRGEKYEVPARAKDKTRVEVDEGAYLRDGPLFFSKVVGFGGRRGLMSF